MVLLGVCALDFDDLHQGKKSAHLLVAQNFDYRSGREVLGVVGGAGAVDTFTFAAAHLPLKPLNFL